MRAKHFCFEINHFSVSVTLVDPICLFCTKENITQLFALSELEYMHILQTISSYFFSKFPTLAICLNTGTHLLLLR